MPVPALITDISATLAGNGSIPAGGESPILTDDYLRTAFTFIAQLRDGPGFGTAVRNNVLGSATVPAFSFVGDTNTGAWSPAADAYAVSTGGTERMRIDSSGNVGIGNTSPGTRLAVNVTDGTNAIAANGSTVGGLVALRPDGTNGNAIRWGGSGASSDVLRFLASSEQERMRIDGSGNVGIGVNPAGGGRLNINGNMTVLAQGRVGYLAETDLSTVAGVSVANYGATFGGNFTGFLGGGTALGGYYGVLFHTAGLERMRIDSSGNVRIGRTSALSGAGEKFTIDENSTGFAEFMIQRNNSGYGLGIQAQNNVYFYATGGAIVGSIANNGTTTTYNTSSDARLKTNITPAADAGALLDAVQVRQFDWLSDDNHQRYGFVAQELVTVVPEAVHAPADPDAMMAVDYSKLVPLLVREIQSLRARVAALES